MTTILKARTKERGFTLIEVIIVVAIIAILLGIAVPIYRAHVIRARETVLREDLSSLRQTIAQFTQDKQRAPDSLDEMVSAGYLGAIPKDPFTNAADWQTVAEESFLSDQTHSDIGNIHSGAIGNVHSSSNQISSEGTAYSTW